MRSLLRLAGRVDGLNERLGSAVSLLVLLMAALGAGNAVLRYAARWTGLRLASNAWLEAQWYLFATVFLLAGGHALARDAHVRVDVFYGRLPTRRRAAVDLAGTLLLLLPFCAFGIWVCFPVVWNSIRVLEVSPDPGGLPRWPVKALLLPAWGLLLLQGTAVAVRRAAFLLGRGPEPPP